MQYNQEAILNHIQSKQFQHNIIIVVANSQSIHSELLKTLAFLQKAGVENVTKTRLQRLSAGEYQLVFTTIEYYGKLRKNFTDYITMFQEGVNQNVGSE